MGCVVHKQMASESRQTLKAGKLPLITLSRDILMVITDVGEAHTHTFGRIYLNSNYAKHTSFAPESEEERVTE